MRIILLIYVLFGLINLVRADNTDKKVNVVFIGNSITYGALHENPMQTSPVVFAVNELKKEYHKVGYVNLGFSGKTTEDFLPVNKSYYMNVVKEVEKLCKAEPDIPLIFSITLGTNDSAVRTSKPTLTSDRFRMNMTNIINALMEKFPQAYFMINRPIYYSTNVYTQYNTQMNEETLSALNEYWMTIKQMVSKYSSVSPGRIFLGDSLAYDIFKKRYKRFMFAEEGKNGKYYLHPNEKGAKVLGNCWADALKARIKSMPQAEDSFKVSTPGNLDLYLCIGQSNMAGRGRLSEQYMDTLENVYVFNDVNTFEPAVNPLNRYSNIRKDISMQGVGPAYSMAKELASESGGKIGIIVNARGGSSINSWLKGSKDGYYEETMSRLRKAMKYGTLKAIVWHQGETDCNIPDEYLVKLSALVNDFRTDLQQPELPFVIGEIAKWNWPSYENKPMGTEPLNKELRKVASVIPDCFCVSSEGLSMLSNERDPHFSAEAQLELGKRYANALMQSRHSVQHSKPVYNSQTKALDRMLKQFVKDRKVMFGMANPTTIGFSSGPINYDIEFSDCKDITGDNPAFHESDFMWYQQDSVFWQNDVQAMKEAWKRGAVIGYCWHLKGPRSGKFSVGNSGPDYYLAQEILSNPDRNTNPMLDWFLDKCDKYVIPVFKELGCPVVFRPFHEMTGGWFWWGKQIGVENYKKLFRLTVDYLRSKGVNNVLYCWSPDKFADFSFYPGDDYVDVVGLDIYEPGLVDYYPHDKLIENLQKICDYAETHDKIAAWTEVGCRPHSDGTPRYPEEYPDFWTKYVFDIVRDNPKAGRVAWISSWYNADWKNDGSSSPYIPYKGIKKKNGRKAVKDFRRMYSYPFTIFEKEMSWYKMNFGL